MQCFVYRIRRWLVLGLALALGAGASPAQRRTPIESLGPVPAGITLPVALEHALRAGAARVGEPVTAATTQRVPLSVEHYLPRGATVIGSVIASSGEDKATGQPAVIALRIDRLRYHGRTVPLRTRTLALANFTAVDDTAIPINGGGDRGEATPANWTTVQIGGDVLMRSGWIGVLDNGATQRVGYADFHGVYADPVRGGSGGAALPRALGAFSSSVGGLYGFTDQARLSSTDGTLTVTSPGKLVLRTGDNLLLEVLPRQ